MSDIVERLRANPLNLPAGFVGIQYEAADEIERLRNEVISDYNEGWEEGLSAMKAENGRLRLALHDIYEVYAGSEGIPEPVTCPEAYLLSLLRQMVEIAKEHKK